MVEVHNDTHDQFIWACGTKSVNYNVKEYIGSHVSL